MSTDTSEAGLERHICIALAGHACEPTNGDAVGESPASYGGVGWTGGSHLDYNREYCVDLVQLIAFVCETQPEVAEVLALSEDGPTRRRFLARLQGEISKRGIVDVLRKGVAHGAHHVDLFYGAPSPGKERARERFGRNRFSVTRQLRYSRDETQRALDIALFVNGLPVVTFELKNSLTKQTVDDAVEQIQHSAGSGKSFSIAWLAHRLIPLKKDGGTVFDSIIVVTDRRILDRQIHDTIRQYEQVRSTVGHADKAADLKTLIEQGKQVIISTIQKFPFILEEIGSAHRRRSFAIIIDEAHSSQGGKAAGAMAAALGEAGGGDGYETYEDRINREIERRKMLDNASYFAFTATPKNKTLELFGEADPRSDGTVGRLPFHTYSMKQAIQEGFILDVLEHYTPVESYYRLAKTVEEDPEYDVRKAGKKLRRYVEGHEHAIRLKAEIMVDHFHEQVIAQRRIGGKARAMVVTNGIERAIQYFHAIRDYLSERRSPHEALVAFSGEHDYRGTNVTEASLNGLPSSKIAETFREDPYRFLVCADKFQTGYDEPLLHTMYVDKTLSGVKAVQTLSRLNRSHRHGKLPGGEAGRAAHPAPGRGRRDRPDTDRERRRAARTRDRAVVEHHPALQRALRGYRVGGRGPRPGDDHRNDPLAGGG